MTQNLGRTFDPGWADDVAVPKVLMRVDDQRIWLRQA
jgi:hypothetical protein